MKRKGGSEAGKGREGREGINGKRGILQSVS